MKRKIGSSLLLSSRPSVLALLCAACLILASVSVFLQHFPVHNDNSFLNAPPNLVDNPFRSHYRLSSAGLRVFPRQLASLRYGNLLSVDLHKLRILRNTSPRAAAPASYLAPGPAPAPSPLLSHPHDCVRMCGKVSIPYPFGLSPECARSSKYELTCVDSNTTLANEHLEDPAGPWPFLSTPSGFFQVTNITSNDLIINATKIKAMPSQNLNCSDLGNASLVLDPSSPFIISLANSFFVSGCRSVGAYSLDTPLQTLTYDPDIKGGVCGPISCTNQLQNVYCNYYDCCTLSLTQSKTIYMLGMGIQFLGMENCGFASILYPPSYTTWDSNLIGVGQYGVQLLWAIQDYDNCTAAQGKPDYACAPSPASCTDAQELNGYLCNCNVSGYQGDGYKAGTGCQEINQCLSPDLNNCAVNAHCANYSGSYKCSCHGGLKGDGYRNGTGCFNPKSHVALIAGTSGAIAAFLVINMAAFCFLRRRWRRQFADSYEFFQPSNSSFRAALMEIQKQDGANVCRIFSFKELKLATNDFSPDQELGKGGFGTVFKGVLVDGTMVAIKKPKNDIGHTEDIKQFLNEVTILSQVNHRNLVKLLGCCLETRAPLLVYEYVPNGNLMEHLQARKRDNGKLLLDWDQRLNIAIGAAEALNYLHSGTLPPILHRDVKSPNILLDDKYCAKVADFGLSRLVPTEATHVSTILQGTPGYMDPEYFENLQVSDKSDVYSFGVVLLELITGEKPVDFSREAGDQNLVNRFLRHLIEARHEDMFDEALIASSNWEILQVIHNVARVAQKCVQRSRQRRPTMKLVLEELILIRKAYKIDSQTSILLESPEEDWRPLKSGIPDSFEEHRSSSSYSSYYKSYSFPYSGTNSSSCTKASNSSIELSHR